MDLKSFREFMWNKRRNEYLRLKYTERYQNDPEPWEAIYKDVSDTAASGITETVKTHQRHCSFVEHSIRS